MTLGFATTTFSLLLVTVAAAPTNTSNNATVLDEFGSRSCVSNPDNLGWCPPCSPSGDAAYCLAKYGIGMSCFNDIGANLNATIDGVLVTGGCACWG